MLVAFSREQGLPEVGTVSTRDQMDDGTPICLSVTIDRRDGSAVFDFEGARSFLLLFVVTVEVLANRMCGRVCSCPPVGRSRLCQRASLLACAGLRTLSIGSRGGTRPAECVWHGRLALPTAQHCSCPRPRPAGTGPQVFGNTNAPPAVSHSAIIYALRCMVTRDIPLNHGCMAPITVRIPPGECRLRLGLRMRPRPLLGRRPAAAAPVCGGEGVRMM